MVSTAKRRRDDRLEVRLTPKAKSMLKRAADIERKTVSAFVLDKSMEAAAGTLADRREFHLTSQQYEAFVTALDAPAKSKPHLQKLFTAASVLE